MPCGLIAHVAPQARRRMHQQIVQMRTGECGCKSIDRPSVQHLFVHSASHSRATSSAFTPALRSPCCLQSTLSCGTVCARSSALFASRFASCATCSLCYAHTHAMAHTHTRARADKHTRKHESTRCTPKQWCPRLELALLLRDRLADQREQPRRQRRHRCAERSVLHAAGRARRRLPQSHEHQRDKQLQPLHSSRTTAVGLPRQSQGCTPGLSAAQRSSRCASPRTREHCGTPSTRARCAHSRATARPSSAPSAPPPSHEAALWQAQPARANRPDRLQLRRSGPRRNRKGVAVSLARTMGLFCASISSR